MGSKEVARKSVDVNMDVFSFVFTDVMRTVALFDFLGLGVWHMHMRI